MAECYYTYQTPLGRITLQSDGHAITRLVLGAVALEGKRAPHAVMNACATQVLEYLAGRRQAFDVAVKPSGTDFQLRVWEEIGRIPYGETVSYAEIARALGNDKAFRAVGAAANRNPVPIVVPCHRVVGSNGALVGYAYGLKVKEFLLNLERAHR